MQVPGKAIEVTLTSGLFDYLGTFLAPAAIAISAIVAYRVAHSTIKTNRSVARKRATIDVILKLESEPSYQQSISTFQDIRDSGRMLSLLSPTSQRDKEAFMDIVNFVNHYELICCGIMEDTLDELFYFHWYRGAFLKHWSQLRPFIEELRTKENNDKLAVRFQLFAESWKADQFVTRDCDKPSQHLHKHLIKNKQD